MIQQKFQDRIFENKNQWNGRPPTQIPALTLGSPRGALMEKMQRGEEKKLASHFPLETFFLRTAIAYRQGPGAIVFRDAPHGFRL